MTGRWHTARVSSPGPRRPGAAWSPGTSLRTRLLVLSAAVLLVVTAGGGLLLAADAAQRAALAEQRDLIRASTASGTLLARYTDQETALRGYLLAGDRLFLEPYEDARAVLPGLVQELQDSTRGRPQLEAAVGALLLAHTAWQDLVLFPELTEAAGGDLPRARATEASGHGKVLFDNVRERARALSSELRRRSELTGQRVTDLTERATALLVGALLVLVALVAVQLAGALRLVVAPLLRLGRDVRVVADGALDHEVQADGPREVAELGRDAEAMRLRLRAETDGVRRGREALEQQGPAVLALQAALEPSRASVAGLSVASRLLPAEGVLAGDWLDVLALPEQRLGIVLGDVSGHGPGPAVFALRLKHMLAAALTGGRSPGQCLAWAARHLGDTGELFATAFVAVVDPAAGALTYASAGHPEALLLSPATSAAPVLLAPTGPLLSGLVAGWGWGDTDHALRPADVLLAYTDGLLEARDEAGRQFGPDRVGEAVAGADADLDALLDRLVERVHAHAGIRLADDCTVVACRAHDRRRTSEPLGALARRPASDG